MHYDPVKSLLGKFFNRSPFMRVFFYRLLNTLLLRTWYVKREIREWNRRKFKLANILDAGCGFGQYSYSLSCLRKHYNISAVDISTDHVADCNTFFRRIDRQNIHFAQADLTTFNNPDSFDLIICVDVMEHILDDNAVFRNFQSSLREGGMVIISTPSDQGGSDAHDHDDGSFIGEHVRNGYNIDAIQQQLKEAGFTRTDAYYTYGKPGHIAWVLSMKIPILMLGWSKLFFILLPFWYLLTFPFFVFLNYIDTRIRHKSGTGLLVKAWK